jgi:hypothetical protein
VPDLAKPNLYAIYDADNTLMGEVRYALQKSIGKPACALCDITHAWNPIGKHAWRNRKGLSHSMHWLHRNEVSSELNQMLGRQTLPCVVAEIGHHFEVLINSVTLAGCEGEFTLFEHLLEQKVRALLARQAPAGEAEKND